jgi:predicted Rossmann fold flavoprotein
LTLTDPPLIISSALRRDATPASERNFCSLILLSANYFTSGILNKSAIILIKSENNPFSSTGSTGDGYVFAKAFGHSIIEPVAGLNGLIVKEKIPSTLKDFTLKNVSLIAKCGKKTIEEFGELTFLSNGLGGPISLTVSSLINRYNPKEVKLYVDLKPPLSFETLDTRIIKDIAKKPNVTYISFLRGFMPAAIIPVFLEKSKIPQDKMMHSLTVEERRTMVSTLKGLEFNFVSIDKIDRAIITAGGINVKEINAKTLESKLVSGLYFAGEVLDVDAFTGGFNMQIALATGYLVGNSI